MIKRYLTYVHSKEPHHRRRHALAVAGVVAGLFFVVWFASFSSRMGSQSVAAQTAADQAAAAATSFQPATAGIEVATTSVYSQ